MVKGVAIIQPAIRNRFAINWLTLLAALMGLTFPSQPVLEQVTGWSVPGPHPSLLSKVWVPAITSFPARGVGFVVCGADGVMVESWL